MRLQLWKQKNWLLQLYHFNFFQLRLLIVREQLRLSTFKIIPIYSKFQQQFKSNVRNKFLNQTPALHMKENLLPLFPSFFSSS